jgi:multidrug transporter EmrE-like cation transporter
LGYLYIFLTVAFTVYGQLILKQQVRTLSSVPLGLELIPFYLKFILTRPLVLSGFISAVFASIAWIGAISKFELSYAYPFMSLNFVAVVTLSLVIFGENLNWYKIIGLAFICVGVLIVAKGS